jgi:hypothetical protein
MFIVHLDSLVKYLIFLLDFLAFLFFFFLVVVGFELRALDLLGRYPTA